ncbi:MAG: YceI family protein [Azospirillaceae bacterium]|nr:YceI family protein [Azospirillaceae bacterium]
MKSAVAAFLIAASLAVPAWAQTGPTNDVAKVEGGQFALDKSHAKILFSVNHFGFSVYYGMFTDFDAKLQFDPKQLTKSNVDVTVQLAGIDTTNPKLDAHLKSADFFDAEKFPTATFKSTAIEVTGPTTGKITGDLTLHGVTKPVVLDATFIGGGVNGMTKAYVVGFSATATLKRSEFGIKTYVPAVSDEVNLIISGEFDRQK